MKVTWLGQAGLLIEASGRKIIVDPYMSNSVEKVNPQNFRRIPVNEDFYKIKPDIMVLTHNHLDHTDPETLDRYLNEYSDITVLASKDAWQTARSYGGDHNYVMFNRGTVWTEGDITFTAVYAEHSDDYATGVIIDDKESRFYVTGDTLYNNKVFKDIDEYINGLEDGKGIDVVFLPINGVGNNMNFTDAKAFAERVGAKKVVPLHFGMFDELSPEDFDCERKVIPQIYKEIEL